MSDQAQQTLIALAGVDIVTPMREHYKVQSSQLNESHQDWNTRGEQEIAKAKSESIPDLFTKLATFKTRSGKAVKQAKDLRRQRLEKKFRSKGPEWSKALTEKYILESKGIDDDDKTLIASLAKQGITDKQLLLDLKSVSGSELKRYREFMVRDKLLRLNPLAFETALSSNEELNTRYNSFSGDPKGQSEVYREWINGQINNLVNPSERLYEAIIRPEVDRMVSTKLGSNKNSKLALSSSNQNIVFQSDLEANLKLNDATSTYNSQVSYINEVNFRKNFFKDIKGGKTATQQAVDSVNADLYKLAFNGKISYDEVDRLFEKTDALNDHAAGSSIPQAFFDNEGETETTLFKAVDAFKARELDMMESTAEIKLDKLEAALATRSISQEDYDKEIFSLQQANFTKDSLRTRIDRLSNRKVLSEPQFKDEADKLQTMITNGSILNLSDDQLQTTFTDGGIYNKAKDAKLELQTAMTTLKFDYKTLPAKVGGIIAGPARLTLNLDNITGNPNNIPLHLSGLTSHLEDKYRTLWISEWNKDKTDTNVTSRVTQLYMADLKANGLGTIDNSQEDDISPDKINEGIGIYSADKDGKFLNWEFKSKTDNESTRTITPKDYTGVQNDIINSHNHLIDNGQNIEGENNVEKILNIVPGSKGSALGMDDVIGAYTNRVFSSEVVLKARLLGITPTKLITRSRDALLNSNDVSVQNKVKLFKTQLNQDFEDPEQLLRNAFETASSIDMLSILNRKGPEGFTNNQYRRFIEEEKTLKLKLGTDEKTQFQNMRGDVDSTPYEYDITGGDDQVQVEEPTDDTSMTFPGTDFNTEDTTQGEMIEPEDTYKYDIKFKDILKNDRELFSILPIYKDPSSTKEVDSSKKAVEMTNYDEVLDDIYKAEAYLLKKHTELEADNIALRKELLDLIKGLNPHLSDAELKKLELKE